jgi:hypothetical protein
MAEEGMAEEEQNHQNSASEAEETDDQEIQTDPTGKQQNE